VHVAKETVPTTQLYMDEAVARRGVRDVAVRRAHRPRPTGLLGLRTRGDGYLGVLNLGVDV
jgi:hypothetical protein